MAVGFDSNQRGVVKNISAENIFTDEIQMTNNFDLSISGTFDATVTVQRTFDIVDDDGDPISPASRVWHDLETYTVPYEDIGFVAGEGCMYRAGVKTGDYTSGTAIVKLVRI